MSDQSDIRSIVNQFTEVSKTKDASRVPLASDVVYSGPMMPEPLHGEPAVRQYITEVAPFVARKQLKWMVVQDDSAAAVIEFEGLNGVKIEGAEFYRIRDGLICEVRVFFDTRPLIQGSA